MKKTTLSIFFAITFFAIFSFSGTGQNQANHKLHFKNILLEPSENIEAFINTPSFSDQNIFNGYFYKIIQFNEIPSQKQREILLNDGIELLDYIPHDGYFASFKTNFKPDALRASNAVSIVDITSAIKLAPMLFEESYPDYALRGDGKIELIATTFAGVNSELAISTLEKNGFEVGSRGTDGSFYFLIANVSEIETLSGYAFINYLEPVYPLPEPENYTGRTLHHSNAIADDFSTGRNYDGSGVSVMLQDDGMIGPHIDFEGRIIEQDKRL